MTTYSPFDLDILTEIINIAIGKAASTLSILIQKRIRLDVVEVLLLEDKQLRDYLRQKLGFTGHGASVQFSGQLQGKGYLLFRKQDVFSLIQLLVPDRPQISYLSASEADIIAEFSNIILGSCISTLGNQAGYRLHIHLPQTHLNLSGEEIAQLLAANEEDARYLGIAFANHMQIQSAQFNVPIVIVIRIDSHTLQLLLKTIGANSSPDS